MKNILTVIVPALNEEENIADAVSSILKGFETYNIQGEIITVNDGSSDNTKNLVDKMMKEDKRIKIINHSIPNGIGASFWDGVDEATGEFVVMLPGDNENDPLEIFRYYNLLEHVDMVIPFVFNTEQRPLFRNIISFIYRFIINTTFWVNFNYTNGTILYRKSILQSLGNRTGGFFFQTDILMRLVKKGYLFAEVPYKIGFRAKGKSKALSFSSLLRISGDYLRLVKYYYAQKEDKSVVSDSITNLRRE